jgi:hypothetical protein
MKKLILVLTFCSTGILLLAYIAVQCDGSTSKKVAPVAPTYRRAIPERSPWADMPRFKREIKPIVNIAKVAPRLPPITVVVRDVLVSSVSIYSSGGGGGSGTMPAVKEKAVKAASVHTPTVHTSTVHTTTATVHTTTVHATINPVVSRSTGQGRR